MTQQSSHTLNSFSFFISKNVTFLLMQVDQSGGLPTPMGRAVDPKSRSGLLRPDKQKLNGL